jgi:pyruvate carboxylase
VRGLATNLGFLRRVFDNREFLDGGVTTSFIERYKDTLMSQSVSKNRAGRVMV